MKYCPVDGDEYLDDLSRCPEHDIELVDEEPSFPETMSWVERFNDRVVLRATFVIFLLAALVYAIAGCVAGVLVALDPLKQSHFERSLQFSSIKDALFPLAIAALGVLIAALALRAYLGTGEPRVTEQPKEAEGASKGDGLMRLLFALTVMFALLWAGTSVATSWDGAEWRARLGTVLQGEKPSDTYIRLSALNYAAYSAGTACLATMGAALMVRCYRRLT